MAEPLTVQKLAGTLRRITCPEGFCKVHYYHGDEAAAAAWPLVQAEVAREIDRRRRIERLYRDIEVLEAACTCQSIPGVYLPPTSLPDRSRHEVLALMRQLLVDLEQADAP